MTNKFSAKQIEIMMDAGRDNALQTKGEPKLLREQRIAWDLYRGREFDMEKFDGKMFVRVRVYLVGQRVYTLTTTASPTQTKSPDISRFLDSFRVEK